MILAGNQSKQRGPLVLVAISRPDNMQIITGTHCDANFNLLSLGLMDGSKAATPLSVLNSVRDFSASGHASANFKNKYWVCYSGALAREARAQRSTMGKKIW